ncbi:DUF397 domain-containing protein [Streptomyces sp. NPDC012623]|uniref:DUF397 domain-containing protein n=1 Tax=unclassified Streptomyces TaxID=2593676 RepID=UPI003699A867
MNSTGQWLKSSYSDSEGDACIEVAMRPATTHVRDSKLTAGPQLAVPAPAWSAFIAYARSDAGATRAE